MANETYYDEIGFETDDVGSGRVERYKGRKNVTDRIAFVTWDGNPRMRRAKVHYKEKHILCTKGVCCEQMGPPEDRVGAVIVHYRTDEKGKLLKPFGYTLKHWVFSGRKFEDIRSLNEEWPLSKHDLKVTCVEEGFQQLKYVACGGDTPSLWQQNDKLKEKILAEAEVLRQNIYLGSRMSAEEIRELLGLAASGPRDGFDPSNDGDFDEMLNDLDVDE